MALQDIRAPTLGQALRPNVWDVVALVLVIGAMVLIVYGGEQTALPLSALDVARSKWLFVFNSNFARTNQTHRSAPNAAQRFEHPPPST
jgi:hypothetical protein